MAKEKEKASSKKFVNIGLSPELHEQAKIISILKKVPLGKYLESCIEKSMKDDKKILEKIRQ